MIAADVVNAIASRYKNGDASALADLHHELEPIIRAAVRRTAILGLPTTLTTDDLAQECWLHLARIARSWSGDGSFLAYFGTSLYHSLARFAMGERGFDKGGKHRCRSIDHDALVGLIGRHMVRGSVPEQAAIVSDYLSVLPEQERRAVELSVLQGETFEGIGATLGISRAGAYRYCQRGLETLRAAYA